MICEAGVIGSGIIFAIEHYLGHIQKWSKARSTIGLIILAVAVVAATTYKLFKRGEKQ